MARKFYIDPVRINFNVERELKESAEERLNKAGFDITSFLTAMLQKLVDGKIRINPANVTPAPPARRPPAPVSEP